MNKKIKLLGFFILVFSLVLVSCDLGNFSSSSSNISNNIQSSYSESELNSIKIEMEESFSELIPDRILEDIVLLPSLDEYEEFHVIWNSSNEAVISNSGKFMQPLSDTSIRLNFVIQYQQQVIHEGFFEVTAVGKETDPSTVVLEWLYAYDFTIPTPLYFPYQVRTEIPGYPDLHIKWSTSNSPFIKVDEDYLMPKSTTNVQNVTVRAQINVNEKTLSRDFKVTVPSDADPVLTKNGLPIVYLNTNGKTISNNIDYVQGTFSMTQSQAYKENMAVESKTMGIRIRGNSTTLPQKKPYRIKFDAKQSLFGMKACKSWALLAEHYDETALRNSTAFYLGSQLSGLAFTPRFYHVEVYLNNVSAGIYVLTDHVQVDSSRVDIVESTEADTGYLLYWDSRAAEEAGAVRDVTYIDSIGPTPVEFKSPERLTPVQRSFIGDYMKKAYDAVRLPTKTFNDMKTYFDIPSAIDYIIVNEIFKNQDIGAYSVYMYKNKGDNFHFGPLWDFDLSSGNVNYADRGLPNYWFSMLANRSQWFNGLMRNTTFRVEFQKRWLEIRKEIIPSMFQFVSERRHLIYKAALANDALYPERNGDTSMFGNPQHIVGFTQYNQYTDYFYNWLNASVKFMDNEISSEEFIKSAYATRFTENWVGNKPEAALETLPKFL